MIFVGKEAVGVSLVPISSNPQGSNILRVIHSFENRSEVLDLLLKEKHALEILYKIK